MGPKRPKTSEEIEISDADLEEFLRTQGVVDDDDDEDEGTRGRADEDDGEDDDDEDSKTGDGAPPEGWQPPTWEELQAKEKQRKRDNERGKKWRLRAQGKDPEWNKLMAARNGGKSTTNSTGTGEDSDSDATAEEIRAQVRAEVAAEYETKVERQRVQSAAVTSLVAAGLKLPKEKNKRARTLRRITKMIDFEEIAVDGDDIEGLDEQIEELVEDHPELFKAGRADEDDEDEREQRPPRRRGRLGGAPSGARSEGDEDPVAQIVRQALGRRS